MNYLRGILILLLIFASSKNIHAECVVQGYFDNDRAMLNLIDSKLFVAEGRIGDRGGVATFELDIGADTSAPSDTSQYNWENAVETQFVLTYSGSSAIFAVGDTPVVYQNIQGSYTDIFIRAAAYNPDSGIGIDDLYYNGVPLDANLNAIGDQKEKDILWLRCDGGYFTLLGTSKMYWGEELPENSQLAYQIKVVTTKQTIPEFSSIGVGLTVVGVLGSVVYFRRRQS